MPDRSGSVACWEVVPSRGGASGLRLLLIEVRRTSHAAHELDCAMDTRTSLAPQGKPNGEADHIATPGPPLAARGRLCVRPAVLLAWRRPCRRHAAEWRLGRSRPGRHAAKRAGGLSLRPSQQFRSLDAAA